MDLISSSLSKIATEIQKRNLSAKEVTQFFFDRAQKYNPNINAFISFNENALQEAEAIDLLIKNNNYAGRLCGIPFSIKDMLCTKGLRTTAGSRMLEKFVPPYDSTVVERLKKEGMIIIGKTNQDEFAMGSSSESSFFGPTKNPWDTERVPGGSSGGAAAAQALRMCAASIGTDTGGSIRQPANFCGVVGVKPTYGRVSRYGIVAYGSSLDQAGPMVTSVEDAALILEVICGHDERDATSSQRKIGNLLESLKSIEVKGTKVGVIRDYLDQGLDQDTEKTIQNSISNLKKAGAEIVELSLPALEHSIPIYYLIAMSEASSNLARYDGVRFGHRSAVRDFSSISLDQFYMKNRGEGFGQEVQRRIMIGTYALSSGYIDAYYKKASQVRRVLMNQYQDAFKECQVILTPVTAGPAFKLGEKSADPLAMYLNDIFTTSVNLAGLPAMSLPFGMSSSGLPIGIQLIGNHFDEKSIFKVANFLESISTEKSKVPNV